MLGQFKNFNINSNGGFLQNIFCENDELWNLCIIKSKYSILVVTVLIVLLIITLITHIKNNYTINYMPCAHPL